MSNTRFFSEDWGVRPVLFQIGNIKIPAYSFFVLLAIIVSSIIYYHEARRSKNLSEESFFIVFAALIGGALGSKIPVWIINYRLILKSLPDITPLLSGRTILGGLIGGLLAVIILKWRLKIQIKMGNQIAPALAMGMTIGRIGCFFRGCCFGIPTHLPWGVDFGDGILRYPTQIFDGLFNFGLFCYLMRIRDQVIEPGKLFWIYLQSYLVFRFLIEFIREEPAFLWGLTVSQVVAMVALMVMNRKMIFRLMCRKEVKI
jgi:phosphatidylglycerol---prolipoprotein diacylglyceryl transferase